MLAERLTCREGKGAQGPRTGVLLTAKRRGEHRLDVLLFGAGATIGQITSGYTDNSNTFDPGGRLGQVVWRISW